MGLSVSSFTDPSLALEEFSKKPSDYELVISDIRMPSMNGTSKENQTTGKCNPYNCF